MNGNLLFLHNFHATNVAIKFANVPPMISINPNPPYMFATIVPRDNPIIAGIPKIIESGNNESAILICTGKKLNGAKKTTPIAYNAANIHVNDISFEFNFSPLYRDFFISGTDRGVLDHPLLIIIY